MNPKDKAKELVDKFKDGLCKDRGVSIYSEDAIYCTLIAVDEILNYDNQFIQTEEQFNYWKEVKQEIEKL